MLPKFPRATPVCEHNEVTLMATTQISQAQIRVLACTGLYPPGKCSQEFGEVYWGCLPHASLGATVLDMCPGVTQGRSMLTLMEPSAGGPQGLTSFSNVFVEFSCSPLDSVGTLGGDSSSVELEAGHQHCLSITPKQSQAPPFLDPDSLLISSHPGTSHFLLNIGFC